MFAPIVRLKNNETTSHYSTLKTAMYWLPRTTRSLPLSSSTRILKQIPFAQDFYPQVGSPQETIM